MFNLPSFYDILIITPAVVVGLTVHEFAHGWVADKLGDPTPRYAGRLTLNPVAHIDPIGLLLLYIAHFGWAKPVPINPYYFRNRRQGLILVSLAGPLANVLAAFTAVLLLGLWGFGSRIAIDILQTMIWINIVLAVFNLIPVPPLDGSKVLAGLMPGHQEWLVRFEQYGVILLLLLVFSGAIGSLFNIVIIPLANLLIGLALSISNIISPVS